MLIARYNLGADYSISDFNTVGEAMDHIATLYEQRLQKENPRLNQLQYRAEDLFRFIDGHREFVALVFLPASQSYKPHDKEWIKEKLLTHLGRQQPAPSSGRGPASNRSNIQSRLGNQRF